MAQQTPAKQLFELLVTKNFDPECLDAVGKPSPDPAETEVFSFDYTAESGNDYGTVVIMLADDSDMQVYFGDNLGKGMEGEDKTEWFDFLYALKHFATKNLMSFSPKNLNRLRYSMQGQAAIKEGLFESWTGTRTTSWNGKATEARLMIKHKRPLGENDARFRYVESLFIETAEGERYKLPFTKLSGGRAMVEHVRNGGRPYDARGQHITEMVTELNVLSRFRRANHGKIFEGDTKDLVEQTNAYYESAQKTLKALSHSRGYTAYFESWNPNVITEEEAVVDGLKHLFVTQSLDSRIEDALPLLARIQQQGNAMKEANIFEAWIDNLAEGTWATPDTPEKQQQLIELLSKEFPVGPDATNATEQLYNLLGDDELFDQLETLSTTDPDADCRQVVMDRMDMLSNDPDIQAVVAKLQIDPAATMNPAEPTDAGMSANPDDAQIPTNEEDLEDVTTIGGDSSDELMADVMTNQQGDEIQENDLDAILRIAGVPAKERPAPDYELEEAGVGEYDGKDTVEYRGIFYVKQPNGSWASLKGDHVAEPAVKQVLDRMHQQSVTNEVFIDPTSKYGVDDTGAYVDMKRSAKLSADARGSATAQAAGPKIGSGSSGGAGGIKPWMAGSSLGAEPTTSTPTTPSTSSNSSTPPQMPAKNMGKADVIDVEEDMFGTDAEKDAKTQANIAAATAANTKMVPLQPYDPAKVGGPGGPEFVPVDVKKYPMLDPEYVRSKDDYDRGYRTEDESPLQGKYGHSGKMKTVSKHADFLTRLKELSGMMRSDKI